MQNEPVRQTAFIHAKDLLQNRLGEDYRSVPFTVDDVIAEAKKIEGYIAGENNV